jgi:hypothetical protein
VKLNETYLKNFRTHIKLDSDNKKRYFLMCEDEKKEYSEISSHLSITKVAERAPSIEYSEFKKENDPTTFYSISYNNSLITPKRGLSCNDCRIYINFFYWREKMMKLFETIAQEENKLKPNISLSLKKKENEPNQDSVIEFDGKIDSKDILIFNGNFPLLEKYSYQLIYFSFDLQIFQHFPSKQIFEVATVNCELEICQVLMESISRKSSITTSTIPSALVLVVSLDGRNDLDFKLLEQTYCGSYTTKGFTGEQEEQAFAYYFEFTTD